MAVILETSLGDITVDLFVEERPKCCLNFLKLCKLKYYNFCLFHSIQSNLVAQTGDPTGTGRGGESVYQKLYGDQARYFEWEVKPVLKHKKRGTLSMVNNGNNMHGSQFFITLGENIDYLDKVHTVFGEVAEGFDVLDKINNTFVDTEHRPYKDVRILHTVVLDDPLDDPADLAKFIPDRSPEPTKEQMQSLYLGVDDKVDDDEGLSKEELEEMNKAREAKANAQILEMVGDLPDVDAAPPENVLFVCKLNAVTTDEDLEIIFSRFGPIKSCEVIKDFKTGKSLQYAFIEFENVEDCEKAYFKMDNVLIDDRRIHVDFSQSVATLKWQHDKDKAAKKQGKGGDEPSRPMYVVKEAVRRDNYDIVLEGDYEQDNGNSREQHKDTASRSESKSAKSSEQHKKSKRSRSRSPGRNSKHSKRGDTDRQGEQSQKEDDRQRGGQSHSSDKKDKHRSRSRDRGRREGSRERDRRKGSRDRRGDSRDRRGGSRDRRGGSRDRRGGSRDRRGGSRDRQESSRDRRETHSSRDRDRNRRH